ncbi:MAG: aromatic aminobenezylarsenical efflux permease ArsG family transporter [bacterium]
MEPYLVALTSACWLGILTSISPCPLATNIAAISYIGKRVDRPGYVLLAGLIYTLGRTISYLVLAILLVASALAVPELSFFLQRYMNSALGPILVVVGLMLLGVFRINMSGPSFGKKLQGKVEKWGLWGAGLLGVLFALSFCPVSAALFFGSLLPLALQHQSSIIIPGVYGIGTALPVVVFAVFIALGAAWLGRAFNALTRFELWARRVTGAVFVVVGLYYIATYILKLDL